MSSSTSVALGPTDFNVRDTTHFGWLRHAAAKSCSSCAPIRAVFVPITHYLVHAATVHTARQVAHLLYEVTKERRAWPKFQMVDVAIQGLVHSIDELCHGTKSPPQFFRIARRKSHTLTQVRHPHAGASTVSVEERRRTPLACPLAPREATNLPELGEWNHMSNHIHLVLRNRPDLTREWSGDEVALRWRKIFPLRDDTTGEPIEPDQRDLAMLTADQSRLAALRARLASLSWFMRCLLSVGTNPGLVSDRRRLRSSSGRTQRVGVRFSVFLHQRCVRRRLGLPVWHN